MPPSDIPVEAAIALEAVTGEVVEPSFVVGTEVGDNPDSLSRVAGEREELSVSDRS